MKILFYTLVVAVLSLGFTACSKCYDCVEVQQILDAQGNVIDESEVHEEVCTADNTEISRRESDGAVCSQ